jgi:hypothetical protein
MNEATEETTMPPMLAKERAEGEVSLIRVYDRFASLRDMLALARVATHAVSSDGDKAAIAGLSWTMHLAQQEADEALEDLNAIIDARRA